MTSQQILKEEAEPKLEAQRAILTLHTLQLQHYYDNRLGIDYREL